MKNMRMVKKYGNYLKVKDRGEYHDFDVQCNRLLLADVFENFRDKCTELCI